MLQVFCKEVMYSSFIVQYQENSIFIDTKRLGLIKKKVRKLEDQLDYESRW